MKVIFARLDQGRYSVTALRCDGVLVKIKTHDRPKFIPHDLAHFVVERELSLKGGFWGKVAGGVMFDGMEVLSGRQMPRSSQRAAQKDPLQEGTQAEVLVAAFVELARAGGGARLVPVACVFEVALATARKTCAKLGSRTGGTAACRFERVFQNLENNEAGRRN